MTHRIELSLTDVVVCHGSGSRTVRAVDRVSLQVPAGMTVGLIGESGSGKSSLARAVVGLNRVTSGHVSINGLDVTNARGTARRVLRQSVQMVFQDSAASLSPRMTVGEALREALARCARPGVDYRDVDRLLGYVELPAAYADRYPHQLSGGQRQRVAVARALAVEPKTLILDEITSALDVSVQAAMLNLLRQLQHEIGFSCLLISHDLTVVRYMSERIAVMYLGQIIEAADVEALVPRPSHPYTVALLRAVPSIQTRRRPGAGIVGDIPDPGSPPSGCRFHPRCPIGPLKHDGRRVCVDETPELRAVAADHLSACHFSGEFESPEPAATSWDQRSVEQRPTDHEAVE